MIKIIRKDGSERLVEIMKDKATNKWRYIDLTSYTMPAIFIVKEFSPCIMLLLIVILGSLF